MRFFPRAQLNYFVLHMHSTLSIEGFTHIIRLKYCVLFHRLDSKWVYFDNHEVLYIMINCVVFFKINYHFSDMLFFQSQFKLEKNLNKIVKNSTGQDDIWLNWSGSYKEHYYQRTIPSHVWFLRRFLNFKPIRKYHWAFLIYERNENHVKCWGLPN